MMSNRVYARLVLFLGVSVIVLFGYGGFCGDDDGNPTGSSAYDISGTVTLNSAAFPAVTISLSGTVSVDTVTDAGGNYTFTGLSNGNYILTPSKAGYTFNPGSLAVTLNGANVASQNFTGTLADTTAPSVPAGLAVTGGSSTEVYLAWSPSTDNVAVAGYYVLRDSVTISTTTATTYTDAVVLQSTAYSYTVTAFDSAGNVSGASSPAFSPVIGSGGGGGGGIIGDSSALVGTWGVQSLHHFNTGAWATELTKLTFNNDGTGIIAGRWNNNGSISSDSVPLTYTVTTNTDGSNTLVMNYTAGAGPAVWQSRFVMSANYNIALVDGTVDPAKQFMMVWIKLDATKTYTNADLNGEYYELGYMYDAAPGATPYSVDSALYSFNGNGNFSFTGKTNWNGNVQDDNGSSTYSVSSGGSVVFGALGGDVQLNADCKLGIWANISSTNSWLTRCYIKKADKAYSNADLTGKWTFIGFGDTDGLNFFSYFGTFTFDSNGNCTISGVQNKNGTMSTVSESGGIWTVYSDGHIMVPGLDYAQDYAMAIGNNGNILLVNSSFENGFLNEREVFIAVKSDAFTPTATLPGFSGNLNQASGVIYDNGNMDWGSDIAVDNATAGGPYIYALGAAFTSTTSAAGSGIIAKFNSAGNILVTARFDGVTGMALAVNQNGVYIAGQRPTPSAYVTIKYDLNLNLITATALAGDASARDIALDNSGNVYVIGSAAHTPTTVGNEYDYKIVKYDAGLVQQGSPVIYDSGFRDEGSGIDLDSAGNIYVTGVKIIASTNTIVTVKYNPAWAPQNTAEYSANVYVDTSHGLFPKIAVDRNSGNVFIAGTIGGATGPGDPPRDFLLIKYSPILASPINVNYPDGLECVNLGLDAVGNVYLFGNYYDGIVQDAWMVVKYNSALVFQANLTDKSASNSMDEPGGIALDNAGNIYLCGITAPTYIPSDWSNWNMRIKRFSPLP